MQRFISLCLSLLTVFMLFGVTAGQAATYRVTLAQASGVRTPIIHGAAWVCQNDECATQTARSGPANTCARLVRELGPVTGFTVDGQAISDEQLTECNARAR